MEQHIAEWIEIGREVALANGDLAGKTSDLIRRILAESSTPKNLSKTLTEMLTRLPS